MAETIAQLIGKVNPKLYADEGAGLLKKYSSIEGIPSEEVKPKAIRYTVKDGIFNLNDTGTEASHSLVYDSSSETLEPVYFFILDLMNDFGLETEKLIDNFTSSPGSGHFAELGQRATIMQQQGTKILADINNVIKSVLNIIYDLKEFRIRLYQYDDLKTDKKESALLSLKQIWLDKVDINKGNSSIKAMALGQAGFQTLIDAFLFVKNDKDVEKIDLNDRVKRILRGRVLEFNHWLGESEKELRKRYEIERTYLKTQVNSLKLYSRWAKPYLKAAKELEMKERGREPALVKTFNTIILELTLLGKKKIDVKEEAISGNLPKEFEKTYLKNKEYYSCVLVNFKFRGIPQKISQQSHFAFGGRAEISFKAYVLNEDELKKLNEILEDSDINDALRLIEGATGESLEQLQEEIDFFLKEANEDEQKMQKDTSNPFRALIGGYKGKPAKVKPKISVSMPPERTIIRSESFAEKNHIRPLAGEVAKDLAFKFFDIYKKAHGMPSYT
ncbi:MAG TPA: hypothetical protein VMV95_01600 [Bacillota bacterium]|nr:hypothetical protein [Bacillota bacterium]